MVPAREAQHSPCPKDISFNLSVQYPYGARYGPEGLVAISRYFRVDFSHFFEYSRTHVALLQNKMDILKYFIYFHWNLDQVKRLEYGVWST